MLETGHDMCESHAYNKGIGYALADAVALKTAFKT
jgi:hypothetical protein